MNNSGLMSDLEKYVVLYDQDDYLIKSPLYLFMQDLFYVSGIPDYAKYLT